MLQALQLVCGLLLIFLILEGLKLIVIFFHLSPGTYTVDGLNGLNILHILIFVIFLNLLNDNLGPAPLYFLDNGVKHLRFSFLLVIRRGVRIVVFVLVQ
jgi:hypothetical protein